MSKFFRSSASDSSSEDEVLDGQADQDLSFSNSSNTDNVASDLARLSTSDRSGTVDNHNSQLLLAALLEERCMNEVLREYQGRRDDAFMQREARNRYLRLSTSLARHNLISTGLEHEDLTPTRQRVREGLDLLSRNNLASPNRPSVPIPLRRLLTVGSDASPTADLLLLSRQTTSGASVFDEISSPSHPALNPSRYLRDFEELGMLGKGGYGVVFHVKHKLDGRPYAIKKVPISAARVTRMRTRGQAEVDDLTREVRTLARLDHPNIVRYHAAWIEWSDVGRVPSASSTPDAAPVPSSDSADSKESLHRIATARDPSTGVVFESSKNSTGVVFEHSTSADINNDRSTDHHSLANQTSTNFSTSYTDGALLRTTEPTLALHLQMGLYPLTLSDFITPSPSSIEPVAHCFHLQPSISILLSLTSGVQYLHANGIIHRDLKPANIFLTAIPPPPPASTRHASTVDLSLCNPSCHQTPITLNVRIGDFGLVSEIARPEVSASSAPVGTEIYRPVMKRDKGIVVGGGGGGGGNTGKNPDIFALGIIFFEMLWRFGTRMERMEVISRLKREGVFPEGFEGWCGERGGEVVEVIKGMLGAMQGEDGGECGLEEIERRLEDILGSC